MTKDADRRAGSTSYPLAYANLSSVGEILNDDLYERLKAQRWEVQEGDGVYDARPWVLCSCKRNYVKDEVDCPDCARDRAADT